MPEPGCLDLVFMQGMISLLVGAKTPSWLPYRNEIGDVLRDNGSTDSHLFRHLRMTVDQRHLEMKSTPYREEVLETMTARAWPWVLETARSVVDPMVWFAFDLVGVSILAHFGDDDWGARHREIWERSMPMCMTSLYAWPACGDVGLPRSRD